MTGSTCYQPLSLHRGLPSLRRHMIHVPPPSPSVLGKPKAPSSQRTPLAPAASSLVVRSPQFSLVSMHPTPTPLLVLPSSIHGLEGTRKWCMDGTQFDSHPQLLL
ncbi:hypothetical protein Sjap_003175 [Stephania japonica]|uniref:Uncharacterized protein n=1 Tax=Stephania japonica TaxID=461633 RepID=A0AAP0PUT9_9MAGN